MWRRAALRGRKRKEFASGRKCLEITLEMERPFLRKGGGVCTFLVRVSFQERLLNDRFRRQETHRHRRLGLRRHGGDEGLEGCRRRYHFGRSHQSSSVSAAPLSSRDRSAFAGGYCDREPQIG